MDKINTDVLIIGAGAAGIRAALAVSEAGADVVIVAKAPVTEAGSTFSSISRGWGIQALVGNERTDRNLEAFYDDIMRVGLGRCHPRLVRILVEESGARLEDLVSYGMQFKKNENGDYIRAKGCFSAYERAFLTESMKNIERVFVSALRRLRIKTLIGTVLDLTIVDRVCWGGWVLTEEGEIVRIKARSTRLATGGAAGIFKDHLVSDEDVGDGYALAHRAGAELTNLEFIQFMLGLRKGNARHFLPLSRLGQEGLLEDEKGRDLLDRHPWDIETRAKTFEERNNHFPFSCRDNSCLVDIVVAGVRKEGKRVWWKGHIEEESQSKQEVVHLAHAFNGGVKINEKAEATIPGLYATGEVAAGPHGADRIGGCMMTATQVFGERAGRFAAEHAKGLKQSLIPEVRLPQVLKGIESALENIDKRFFLDRELEVRQTMTRYASILRTEKGLGKCQMRLLDLENALEKIRLNEEAVPTCYFRLRNMIQKTAKLVTCSALSRKQSLGPHYREDFPSDSVAPAPPI